MTTSKSRQLILVTGAPRSGTTPIGHMVGLLPGTATVYEPMGPTGDRRFANRFPVFAEPGLDAAAFERFLEDLRALDLQLKAQDRAYYGQLRMSLKQRLVRKAFGTQSLHSLRIAKARSLWSQTVLWKDPNAALSARAAAQRGVKVIVCLRSAEAVASSFKRNGWVSDVAGIYARYAAVNGAVPAIDAALSSADLRSPAQTSAILWHLIYHELLDAVRDEPNMVLVDPLHMELNEEAEYRRVLAALGLDFVDAMHKHIARRTGQRSSALSTGVHDWSRSVAETNSYWKKTLDADEIGFCGSLNGPLWEAANAILTQQGHRQIVQTAS